MMSLILGLQAFLGCTDDNNVDDVVATDGAAESTATGTATGTATSADPAKDEKSVENPEDKAQSAESKDQAPPPEAAAAPVPAEATTVAPSAAGTGYVTTAGLNVRQGPGVSYPVVRVLGFGEQVTKVSSGSWTKIGEGEFVYSAYIADSKPEAPVANPIVASTPKATTSQTTSPKEAPQETPTPKPAAESAPTEDSPSE